MRSRAMRRSVSSVCDRGALVSDSDIAARSGLLPLPAGERGFTYLFEWQSRREAARVCVRQSRSVAAHSGLILRSVAPVGATRLEGWPHTPRSPPSFETRCDRRMPTATLLRMRSESFSGFQEAVHRHCHHADPNPLTPPLSPAGRGSRPNALRGSDSTEGLSPSRWHTA